MNKKEPFTQAVLATRTLVELPFQAHVVPEVQYEHPTRESHLSWMLARAIGFFEQGALEKAYLWLGYVQGVLAMRGIPLVELDLANRDEESVGSYLSTTPGKSKVRMLKLLAGMALAMEIGEEDDKDRALFWLGGLGRGASPRSLELLDLVLEKQITFNEARARDTG